MDLTSLRLAPADPKQHLRAVAQTMADAFSNGQYADEIGEKYFANCHYDWNTSRLIWDGERLVHHWGVWGYAMRLETLQLRVAGVGAVFTEESYRKRGLMAMAANASFEAMRANGYDLSVLRGRHYVKFGYARAWNYVTYYLKLDEIPSLELQRPYQLLGPDHMRAIDACYNQSHQGYSGTVVRPTYRMLQADDMNAYGWFDASGKLEGYVRAVPAEDQKTLQCLEACGDPQQGLAVLAELFKRAPYERLAFFTLPQQHPLLKIIRQGACVVENRYFHNTGWRVRIVNLVSTLEKIRPLLEARLKRSWLANWQGALLLDAGEQRATLHIQAGRVRIQAGGESQDSLQGGAQIGRLLIGSDEPGEVLQQAQMTCTGDAAELASVLFPNLYPVMSHWDEY